jgi:PTH1 family peptidyl-tRNA hydrolase
MLFSKNKAERWLVAGLGNPESRYNGTRHNVGFAALDYLAGQVGADIIKKKYNSFYCDTEIDGVRVILCKPLTYMNNSGEAVSEIAQFYKIPPERIVVIFDDISLPPGKIRIRRKGSAGGHNGIKSIIALCGSENFPRVKIGVGAPPRADYDLADWVLSKFSDEDKEKIEPAIKNCAAAVRLILKNQIDKAMNQYTS